MQHDASLNIPAVELDSRAEKLLRYVQSEHLAGVVLFDNYYVLYFTGFAFAPTERPIAFLMNGKGEKALFVPRLELEHAQAKTGFDRVDHYVEYPYQPHPMEVLKQTLASMDISGPLAVDHDGYPWILGYRGPSLSDVTGQSVSHVIGFIEDLMAIKSENEIALIRESARWGNLAHRLLQRYTKVGATETEVSWRASYEATHTMLDTLGHLYQAQSWFDDGAGAGYRGQIGRNAAIPHALANNLTFQAGDVLVTGASAPMWGYNSELERTMIIGEPNQEQREMFDHMVNAQDAAFDVMRAGATCAEVDRSVRAYFEANDLMPYWKHHSGHAIGLRYHEGPFLDAGDDTVLDTGMVFTVEPGLYAPALGGFRHSDTVVIRQDGIEFLTYYPRDLESLVIPV
jgi:Xaa-Pro dipeptidase